MRFLVVGLGSMGKRRIRCLKALNQEDVIGFDLREDRRNEAKSLQPHIQTVGDLKDVDFGKVDAMIISVPPDRHVDYIKIAIEHSKPAFVEASVNLEGLEELNDQAKKKNVLIAPSCTLRFHPLIQGMTAIVKSGKYGKFTNFSYHSGQYLPDWHPWEKVADYYVSKKETGGGREIVPFELSWLVDTIGWPTGVKAFYGKTMDVGADIDDSYALTLKFKQGFGTLLVDVASRYAVRSLVLNMERAQIVWRWDDGFFSVYEADSGKWIVTKQPEMQAAQGYNKNIVEEMYIQEVNSFIQNITGKGKFPSTLDDDIEVLKILYRSEGKI